MLAFIAVLVVAFDVAAFYRGYILADETVPAQSRSKSSWPPIIAPLVAGAQAAYLTSVVPCPSPVGIEPAALWYTHFSTLLMWNFVALALSAIGHQVGGPSPITMLRGYLTYGTDDPGAGGVWRHRLDRSTRVRLMALLVAAVSFAIPLNLQWFRGHDQQIALDRPTAESLAEARKTNGPHTGRPAGTRPSRRATKLLRVHYCPPTHAESEHVHSTGLAPSTLNGRRSELCDGPRPGPILTEIRHDRFR